MTGGNSVWERIVLIRPLKYRNFRFLWLGSVLSYLSGQLTMLAFPWLVLKLTGDPFAMGAVLAAAGIPRAVFMVVGGAMTDRYSARSVMMWTTLVRFILMFILATLVYTQSVDMWMIFIVAFFFGAADAFYWPASISILPKLLPAEDLPAGNSLQQGLGQLSQIIGPVLGGLIIAYFAATGAEAQTFQIADLLGISVAFYIDGIALGISFVAISLIRMLEAPAPEGRLSFDSAFASIKEGLVAAWQDPPIRMMALMFAFFSIFFRGPYVIGIPVLCNERFAEGALSFGFIGSAFGVGALLGMILAGSLRKPPDHLLGMLIILDIFALGLGFIVYALAENIETMMMFSAVTGLTDGYMSVLVISFIQLRVPGNLLGRVMSVIMLFNIGMLPLSAAIAGGLIRLSLEGVFIGAGSIMIVIALAMISKPNLRRLGLPVGA
ncbi:MAG: MFS family permease [Candidatus Azotimanducaceae bacterium]|jgi:MFS family permease